MSRTKSKKYILRRDKPLIYKGKKLFPIIMLWGGGNFHVGELGGYIENEDNLSHKGFCWVYPNAKIWGKSKLNGDICLIQGEMGDDGNINTKITSSPSQKDEPYFFKQMRKDSRITEKQALNINLTTL